jgi:4-diphosphocytidyl-2-C-methyl-D-erythritol kinase
VSESESASVFAPAKINLFLHVGARRTDGYHEICSLAAFADVGDRVEGACAGGLSLAISGPFAAGLSAGEDNLVMRAARALQTWARAHGRQTDGAQLRLEKNLPVASGVGGGSSDAAATLKLLDRVWRLSMNDRDIASVGATLGADVPVCAFGGVALMEGIGDRLTPWSVMPKLPVVLVNPGVSVMTADVFRRLETRSGADAPALVEFESPEELTAWLGIRRNDLEAPARRIAPIIGDVLAEISAMPSCLIARMSGSGATCFGIFESDAAASAAATALSSGHPRWWVVPSTLR